MATVKVTLVRLIWWDNALLIVDQYVYDLGLPDLHRELLSLFPQFRCVDLTDGRDWKEPGCSTIYAASAERGRQLTIRLDHLSTVFYALLDRHLVRRHGSESLPTQIRV